VARFGSNLPFLVKVLAAARPLSIQVHPNTKQAQRGFEEEEHRGVALDARERSYSDPRHKIELMIALDPFSALCGFRPPEQVNRLVHRLASGVIDGLCTSLDRSDPGLAARIYFSARALSSSDRDRLSEDLLAFARRHHDELIEAYWVLRLARLHPGDPGALAPLLLNLLVLAPGDGLYITPGTVHSYLEGGGVEVMSNSDNVVRGGLTTKYIDEAELRRLTVRETLEPLIIRPVAESPGIVRYAVPAEEFLVRVLSPGDSNGELHRPPADSARILLCVKGSSTLRAASGAGGTDSVELQSGEAAWIPAVVGEHKVSTAGRRATLYEVSVA
jgi:mannose-6-phosphate isomerase